MRSVIAISVLVSGALAVWNPKICNGAGGCVSNTFYAADPFRCPDGTTLNVQQTASNSIDSDNGSYEIVSKAEFPTSCLTGEKPGDDDFLVVHTTQFKQKMYVFMKSTCTETSPKMDCYTQTPNKTRSTICQIMDTKGQKCVMNPRAGECERWGTDSQRPQCEGWNISKPEPPTTE